MVVNQHLGQRVVARRVDTNEVPETRTLTRAEFLALSVAGAATLALPARAQEASRAVPPAPGGPRGGITADLIRDAEPLIGVAYPATARSGLVEKVKATREGLDKLRADPICNATPPAFVFRPEGRQPGTSTKIDVRYAGRKVLLPSGADDLAFFTVADLATLLRAKQISSVELTRYFLKRLETYGPGLNCVITLTPERALRTAALADARFAKGEVLSPLQGVPTGIKDLFAMLG
ncbi:MAG: hypothetical protein C4320_02115, partial [Armatimonadota bacterium]